ncbi:MAG: stage II sporulation protein M [Candidatus Hydrogenedentes bacterium]|nr:stage II sporulation protein M [Candidatus Hydrogenedentota bacterium]
MILNIERFIREERPYWDELEGQLESMARDMAHRSSLEQLKRFHYLYQRASAGLAKMNTYASEPELKAYLETLVARAYGEMHETRQRRTRLRPVHWFFVTFPCTFRRHLRAFTAVLLVTSVGAAFGCFALATDNERAKRILMPFEHLQGDPSERVAYEQNQDSNEDRMAGSRSQFAAYLMQNNIKVSITAMALGITWGIGTVAVLFYNGIMIGAVCYDYIAAGQTVFLIGWLLPHGSIEIPAIFLAGQAGFVLAGAIIGWGSHIPVKGRLRKVTPDIVTLLAGVAVMLVWAGIVESFFSQYHEPVLPYWLKIAFGCAELIMLIAFLGWAGRKAQGERNAG